MTSPILLSPDILSLYKNEPFDLTKLQFGQLSDYVPHFISAFDADALVAKIKLASFFLSVLFSLAFMIILMKIRMLRPPAANLIQELNPPSEAKGGAFRARWKEITDHMESAKEAEWKFAVIEADKLADLVLRRGGFNGDTMGDRLMNIQPDQLTTLDILWEAHKVRNQLAHNVDYFLRYTEAKQAIQKYEKFLEEMEAI